MKPAGRERDIEIAKLKGIKVNEDDFFLSIPYWSTNRNDAWELEKEMINDGLVLTITIEKIPVNKYLVLLTLSYPHKTKSIISMLQVIDESLDKAVADCVSQAYIIWKQ